MTKKNDAKAKAAAPKKAVAVAAKAAEAETKGKHQTAMNTLAPLAKEINVRFDKAAKLDSDADDHRLAAALQLAEARKVCEKAGVNFKKWAEKNISQSYENVRKLAAVGAAKNPKLALEDLRGKNRKANKALREKRKAPAAIAGPSYKEPTKGPYIAAEEALARLDDKHVVDFLRSKANGLGMKVVSETEAKKVEAVKKVEAALGEGASLAAVKKAFTALKATEKMTFMHWAAKEIGVELKSSLGDVPAGDDFPVLDKDGKLQSTLPPAA